MSRRRYLLLATRAYSLPVLAPLANWLDTHGAGEAKWYLAGDLTGSEAPGAQLTSRDEVEAYQPDAVLVPGNVVPDFWPGLKAQLFHGLGEEKRGHYRITGFFDLYCTPGPYLTARFEALARQKGHFLVEETGWPKLDPLAEPVSQNDACRNLGLDPQRPVLLYAPTFSPRYTSAKDLLPVIAQLVEGKIQWLVKLHDLEDPDIIMAFAALEGPSFQLVRTPDIMPLLQAANLLITDTSSVAYEFLILDRPIITYRAAVRADKGINIETAGALPPAIEQALSRPDEHSIQRQRYLDELHPYRDGESSGRVISAIENVLESNAHRSLKRKPWRPIRRRQIRRLKGL